MLGGSVQRSVAHTQTWRGQKNLKVLRVVAPVRLKGQRQAIGAVLLDQDYRRSRSASATLVAARVDPDAGAARALHLALPDPPARHPRARSANRRLREDAVERERLLEAERAARAEAESARQLLAAQNDRLRELDALKDEFISLVSHELRTPLTSIRGYVELLQEDDGLGEEQQRYLGVVDRNSARLLDLVSDLLFLAQVDAGKLAFELQPVDLEVLVAECIGPRSRRRRPRRSSSSRARSACRPRAGRSGAARAGPRQSRLQRAQVHPCRRPGRSGAVRGRRRGGRRGRRHRARPDRGRAGPPLRALLPQFARRPERDPGTGLGLAIAKTIVERHGRRIELESVSTSGRPYASSCRFRCRAERSPQELAV